jgi:hypothetical protein
MNLTRTVALGVLGGAVAVWLAAAATTGTRPAEPVVLPQPNTPDISSEALKAEIARLHERLRPSATPLQTRDLFRYVAVEKTRTAQQPTEALPLVPPAPAAPPVKLIGIAEDGGADGPVRTAVLSWQGELIFAKEGDSVSPQYQVSRISSEVVELLDTSAGSVLRIALK